jgi:chromosome partitioning protein
MTQSISDNNPPQPSNREPSENAHIIVFGNEKGGSGKSTSAIHTAIALLRLGYKVATIDLDARQGTMTQYLKNRWDYNARADLALPSPTHMPIEQSAAENQQARHKVDHDFFAMALAELSPAHDFIIIDTPGSHNYLSRLAHGKADTIVTPLNDSFLDLDLIGRISQQDVNIIKPSVYTQMVAEQMTLKTKQSGEKPRWIVMRNRVAHNNAHNKQRVGEALQNMSAMFDFTLAPGFGERVIFREMFPDGLTLLDLKKTSGSLSLSEISARMEVRQLIMAIDPANLKGHRAPPRMK